jgi:hypothetical protein
MPLRHVHILLTLAAFWVALCLAPGQLLSQGEPMGDAWGQLNQRKGLLYKEELSGNFTLHSNGYVLSVVKGEIETYYRTKYRFISFGNIRHPREFNQSVRYQGTASAFNNFTFGKRNSFFALRGGIGYKRYLSEKAKRKGVAVAIDYAAGANIGILKPYYLVVSYQEDGIPTRRNIKYSEEYEDLFLDVTRILDSGSLFKGIGESRILPGIYAKLGLHFDIGATDEYIKALEVGIQMDQYFTRVPIMVREENSSLFLNLYLTLQFGKRN